jgi:hypothetical protein
MMTHTSRLLCASALLASFLLVGLGQSSGLGHSLLAAAESKSNKKSEATAETSVTHRLPRYFASIIDDDQRAQMQVIRAGYETKLMALRQELSELEAAQLKELEELLTSSQRKSLDEMRSRSGNGASRTKSASTAKSTGNSSDSSSQSARSKTKQPTKPTTKPTTKPSKGSSKSRSKDAD